MTLRTLAISSFAALLFAACGSSDHVAGGGDGGDGSFKVTGQVEASAVGKLSIRAVGGEGITHVMAVNPTSANPKRVLAPVADNGAFSLSLSSGVPWVLVFVDSSKTGSAMIQGIFRASDLDTLATSEAGTETDLQTIGFSGLEAESSVDYDDLIAGLGLDAATAETLGAIDDVCLRYVNPDIDGDGEIDLEQEDHGFVLDFHVRFNFEESGNPIEVGDLDAFPDFANVTTGYANTGVYVAYPEAFSSATTGTVVFDTAVQLEGGGSFAAGATISSVTANAFGDYNGYGPNLSSSSELPQDDAVFAFGGKTLTFTNIATPTLAEIDASVGRLFPFVRLVPADAGCGLGLNCVVGSAEYKWMKRTASGWTPATEAELALIVSEDGGYLSMRYGNDSGPSFGLPIPRDAASGSLDWSYADLSEAGLNASQFANLTYAQIYHVGLSYDDQLGMRYFLNIANNI